MGKGRGIGSGHTRVRAGCRRGARQGDRRTRAPSRPAGAVQRAARGSRVCSHVLCPYLGEAGGSLVGPMTGMSLWCLLPRPSAPAPTHQPAAGAAPTTLPSVGSPSTASWRLLARAARGSQRLQTAQDQPPPTAPFPGPCVGGRGGRGGLMGEGASKGEASKACNLPVSLSGPQRSPQPHLLHHSRTPQLAWGAVPSWHASPHSHTRDHTCAGAHVCDVDGNPANRGPAPTPRVSPGQRDPEHLGCGWEGSWPAPALGQPRMPRGDERPGRAGRAWSWP